MSFLELLGLFLSSAGTLASILGIFFARYAKYNGQMTRDFIAAQNKEMREFIATQSKEMREFTAEVLKKLDERAEARHREAIGAMKR